MMKKLILVLIIGFAAQAFSQNLSWSNLIEGKMYTMNMDIVLNDELAPEEEYVLRKGDLLNYESTVRMDNYIALTFKNSQCQDESKGSSDMVFLNPDPAHQDSAHHVGVSFYVGCYNTVYMSPMTYPDLSFLTETTR